MDAPRRFSGKEQTLRDRWPEHPGDHPISLRRDWIGMSQSEYGVDGDIDQNAWDRWYRCARGPWWRSYHHGHWISCEIGSRSAGEIRICSRKQISKAVRRWQYHNDLTMTYRRRLRDPIVIVNIWLSGGFHGIFRRNMNLVSDDAVCGDIWMTFIWCNHGTWTDDFLWMPETDVPRDRNHDIERCYIWYSCKPHKAPIDCFRAIFTRNMNFTPDYAVIAYIWNSWWNLWYPKAYGNIVFMAICFHRGCIFRVFIKTCSYGP